MALPASSRLMSLLPKSTQGFSIQLNTHEHDIRLTIETTGKKIRNLTSTELLLKPTKSKNCSFTPSRMSRMKKWKRYIEKQLTPKYLKSFERQTCPINECSDNATSMNNAIPKEAVTRSRMAANTINNAQRSIVHDRFLLRKKCRPTNSFACTQYKRIPNAKQYQCANGNK